LNFLDEETNRVGILIDKSTQAIVQGITGTQGRFHTKLMMEYGTQIVAGVTPGKGGKQIYDIPVYDTVAEAQETHSVDASIVFVPAPFAKEAVLEALENKIRTIVIITEHIPIKDAIHFITRAKEASAIIIGPNTPGIITPRKCKLGIMPPHIFKAGNIGMISRSGTLTYEIAVGLTRKGFGQSTCIGLGGDQIVGLTFVDALKMFELDPQTKAITLIGEIGGNLEEAAAEYIAERQYRKPVVAFITGRSAIPGKRMGHAGAIVMGKAGTAENKVKALKTAGVTVVQKPSDVAKVLTKIPSLNV
jgi:succinyl-CoA synthetase alpha subunit